jgi:O-antigen/teichoic acid export membrane protein
MLGTVFIINILLSRHYDLTELGTFNFCYAISQIGVLGLGSGFSLILRRELTLSPNHFKPYINAVLKLRFFLLGGILLLLLPIVLGIQSKQDNILIYLSILILSKGFDSFSETYYTSYQSIRHYKIYTIIKSLNAIFSLLAVAVTCLLKMEVLFIYLGLLTVSVLFFCINIIFSKRTLPFSANKKGRSLMALEKYFIKESWPLMINAVFFQIGSRIPVVVIFAFMGKYAAGVFSVGLTLVTIFTASANALGVVLFPKLNNIYHESPERLWPFIKKTSVYILMLGTGIYGMFMIAFPYLKEIFGKIPKDADAVFFMMGIAIPFIFLLGVFGNIFTIIHQQKKGMWIAFTVVIINLITLILFLHYFYEKGFAIAYSAGSVFHIAVIMWVAQRLLKKKPVITE